MNAKNTSVCDDRLVEGTIESINVLSREFCLRVAGELIEFVLPSDCTIMLNHQFVKLRLLQPKDHVAVAYSVIAGVRFAHEVEVTWPQILQKGD